MYDDAKKADSFIQKLSGIYRYILDNEETDLIPLKEELDFVEQYFNLQKERDNGKISLKIDIQNKDRYKNRSNIYCSSIIFLYLICLFDARYGRIAAIHTNPVLAGYGF